MDRADEARRQGPGGASPGGLRQADASPGDEITSGEPYRWPRYTPLVLDLEEPEGECCPQCAEPLRIVGYCGACGWRVDQ